MNSKKNLKRNLLICLLAGSAVMYTLPLHAATSVIANNTLPSGWQFVHGEGNIASSGLEMNITQNGQNAVIKWNDFSVGGNATVNFDYTGKDNFNTLNYVNSGKVSQIYGTINAQHEGYNGNIFIVNTAGVQIGPSAQINVGSLHVSSNTLDDNALKNFYDNAHEDKFALGGTGNADAVLMSLGNINATNVTFEGDGRIVIDSERIKDEAGNDKLGYQNINITTSADNTDNIIIGYDAYDETNGYKIADPGTAIATVNGSDFITKADGYMWVEDVEQLQAINTNLSGNYALRNSIDATATSSWNNNEGFKQIGTANNEFTGKFDGLDYNIFGLTINRSGENNVGLFGVVDGANINNVTLVGGSITGGQSVGAIVGSARDSVISNSTNSTAVNGDYNIGGIVGDAQNSTLTNLINTGTIGAATGDGNRIGGLVGNLQDSSLGGNSYNLGAVTSVGHDVGGLVGHAYDATIGDGTNLVYNRLDVTGAYNVGGIVGNMESNSTVQNAENSGTVLATWYDTGTYKYHAGTDNTTDIVTEDVNVANVGGIVGISSNSTITNVENSGDVSTETIGDSGDNSHIYRAGNVGGVVGSAVNTNITNATNKENSVRGAHNVGGIAGYFSGEGTINKGINDGGDIMATGARHNGQFITEMVRANGQGNENFIIGNIGGVVGYMDGDDVYVTGSANRGTVHTYNEFTGTVPEYAKAANVGGIVGKIDRESKNTLEGIKNNPEKAAVKDSYNTGDILGYTGVGGVIGMMYNGAVTGSYNLGTVNTTRQIDASGGNDIDPLNMGGVVGDTTEQTEASAVIYDVYNKGQIGDDDFVYFARHVGGVVGRLNGDIDKAYNNGDIYNKDTAVGGIVGWWYGGNISNVFNTGNITVRTDTELQVGGIVGAAEMGDKTLKNSYNLGTIRGFQEHDTEPIYLGGIIGRARGGQQLSIDNVYTLGNLYAGRSNQTDGYTEVEVGAIYGGNDTADVSNAFYITPESDGFSTAQLGGAASINFDNRYKGGYYGSFDFSTQTGGTFTNDGVWRIYEGSTTPILNAFLPNTEKYFGNNKDLSDEGITSIQYGTAYDPLLTIINAKRDLSYDWNELGISGAASIAVYGGGLTLDNVDTSGGTGYYAGLLYSDGDLILNADIDDAQNDGRNINGDIGLSSAAKLYGSSVNINADGKVTIYGSITSTAENEDTTGDIKITASDVDIYGTLTSAKKDNKIDIIGISNKASQITFSGIDNPDSIMPHISNRFTHSVDSKKTGNITITANGTWNDADNDNVKDEGEVTGGNVNLYYGNKEQGLITTGGDLTVTGTGDVYVDSDLSIGGGLSLTAGADKEIVLDISNIGQVQKNHDNTKAVKTLHDFLDQFSGNNAIKFNGTDDAKITVDMWQGDSFDLDKFDIDNNNTFAGALTDLKVKVNGADTSSGRDITHIWVSSGEQLKNIQTYYNEHINDTGILGYNFALKNDINASDVSGYEAIGTNSANGFTGTFDGRGNRIIGLTVSGENAGIFSTVGKGGVVKDVNIYSGTFTGKTTAGAVAGVNNGRIEGIVTFGNTVTSKGKAGGIVGVNNSGEFKDDANDGELTNGIYDVESTGSVIAGSSSAIAGGLVGTNNGGLANSFSDSAVTVDTNVTSGTSAGLGGVVGINNGNVQYVDSLGVTNGGVTGSSNIGGIIGTNNGNMYSGYNESIVSGSSNVGGIIGNNSSTVANVVNATSVTGNDKDTTDVSEYVGGLVGNNNGDVNNGRNNGTITGTKYVGGMVGNNAEGSTLTNLVNDSSAAISGVQYVGGIAGKNEGIITANSSNLINRGSITGNQYVGGVAGMNTGKIRNTVNSVVLNATGNDAKYFGGVAGYNDGTIGTVTNTSTIDVIAQDGTLVGGIIGYNAENGTLEGEIVNEGNISGESEVGGIIGENINQSILNNENKPRLTISNKGNVSATDGGAAGIFYDNKSVIDNVDLVNEGTVTGGAGANSITGGLFGVNSGNITNSTLTNNGEVTGGGAVGGLIGNNSGSASGSVFTNDGIVEGEDKVGGLFGINSGSFNTSSLINTVNAQVTGKREVGGLIGVNSGNIEGGRLEANGTDNGYYKYQIYNNGTINVTEEGTYIGGLFGTNSGEVKAAYNTGVINAGQSSNVGGIAGVNEQGGKLDQVFNTVMTGVDDKGNTLYGTITGKDNVGGLVGTNSGTLSNAYNTTEVNGAEGSTGNAVGVNDGNNAKVNFIYDVTNTNNTLIGENTNNATISNSYTSADAEKGAVGTDGITYVSADKANDKKSYGNFADGTWKFYDGQQTPLLSVFLTKVKIDQDKVNEYMSAHKVYNGTEQKLTADDIKALIDNEAIYVEGLTKEQAFEAFYNNNDLISSVGHTNAGQYSDWLYSQQIASSGSGDTFNPNNLGYDIALTGNINKAKLTINLGEVTHTYGNPNTNGYKYTVEGWINADDANDYTISIGTLGKDITDDALKDNNTHTKGVGKYTWSTTANISANGTLNNYEIVTVNDGTSKVIPVTIDVTLNEVTHIYGDSFNSNDYTVGNVNWVNGDNYTTADVVLSDINDGAFTDGNGGKTNDVKADGYKWDATVSGNGANAESINKNYIFNVIDGDSKVTPKEVTIEDILASIEYGSKGDFTVENTGNINGTVYDDNLGISYTDTSVIAGSEYALNQNGRDTADVKVNNGVYTDSISINGIKLTGDKAGNYYISSDTAKGDIRVDKAQIHIGANNEAIHVSEKPDYIGTDINGALVNGDKLNGDYYYGVENSADENVVGKHSIGVWIGNTFYDLSATVDWTKVEGFFRNYEVTYNPGTLTVTEQVMPDLPDNWPNNRWDYLFGDNPFDRNENFRERKAEVNFIDGAMEI